MSSDFERTLRRLHTAKLLQPLKPRSESELAFAELSSNKARTLLYDTTVYVDMLQGRFPARAEAMLRSAEAWHSTVAEAELASACALLDPAHAETRKVIREITAVADRISPYRIIAPDREVWRAAGILSGAIARLQRLPKSDRRRILNDALVFATAGKHGHTVLTRNIIDFDFLNQLDPTGRVLFYKI